MNTNSSQVNTRSLIFHLCIVLTSCVLSATTLASDNLGYTAVVKSGKTALLSSQIDGQVAAVYVKPGDSFLTGDVLLSIDCALPVAALNRAKAELEFARNEYKSTKELNALNSTTRVQVARTAAQFAIASADADAAQYQVNQCILTAPFDGTVVQSWVNPHESVQQKKELLKIVSNTDLSVEFLAPSNQLAELYEGRNLRLSIMETDADYELSIDKIIPVVDSVSQTVKVISHIEVIDNRLWSGMSGRVSLVSEDAQGLY